MYVFLVQIWLWCFDDQYDIQFNKTQQTIEDVLKT
jgi:hypothetical protein